MSIRVHELAKEIGISSKELIAKLKELKVDAKSHMSTVDKETAEIVRHELEEYAKEKKQEQEKERERKLKTVQVHFPLTVKDLAIKIGIKPNELIKKLMKKSIMANLNQTLDERICKEIAEQYKVNLIEKPSDEEQVLKLHEEQKKTKNLETRAPVVTLMGHVDHGKTLLLDKIRESNIADQEAGSITQHIGAYEVKIGGNKITFLDTPGHEAFTAMRARGANVTDIVILVIAVDDGVMPQTKEAIDHARAADVPIIVALNKIDKPHVNIDKVKGQLQEADLTPEDLGGEIITVAVSAKTGEGVEHLLEMITLQAEMMELKANPEALASGVIVEAKKSTKSGAVATVLVQNGTLRVQDIVISGLHFAKVRAMINDRGEPIKEAGPSSAAKILGLSGIPEVGDSFYVVENEKKVKSIIDKRRKQKRENKLAAFSKKITLEDITEQIQKGQVKTLKVILKTDVQGSLEAITSSLEQIKSEEVKLDIIHQSAGSVNESDVMLALASSALIIGFGVGVESKASQIAKSKGIEIKLYSIIYELISDVKAVMSGLLEPQVKRTFMGRADVRQVFDISKLGMVAGCMVTKGTIIRGEEVQVKRNDEVIYNGRVDSLKRFKNDVKEVKEGFECGIGFDNFNNIKVGDTIEVFRVEKIKRTLL
jgi:translation initiation factor IF-2